ncbi:MAG: methyltransferase domain-containing protein [Elusimicrobiales bacterium]
MVSRKKPARTVKTAGRAGGLRARCGHGGAPPARRARAGKSAAGTREFFDRLAPVWDSMERKTIGKVINKILDRINPGPGDCVLDVACGTGALTPFLLKRGVKNPLSLDFSGKMALEFSRKFPRLKILVADYLEKGLFPEETFSRIIVYNAYPHFGDRRALFSNSFRYLKAGGGLYIAHSMSREELNNHHRKSPEVESHMLESDEAVRALYAAAGFENIVVDNGSYFYSCGFKPVR